MKLCAMRIRWLACVTSSSSSSQSDRWLVRVLVDCRWALEREQYTCTRHRMCVNGRPKTESVKAKLRERETAKRKLNRRDRVRWQRISQSIASCLLSRAQNGLNHVYAINADFRIKSLHSGWKAVLCACLCECRTITVVPMHESFVDFLSFCVKKRWPGMSDVVQLRANVKRNAAESAHTANGKKRSASPQYTGTHTHSAHTDTQTDGVYVLERRSRTKRIHFILVWRAVIL